MYLAWWLQCSEVCDGGKYPLREKFKMQNRYNIENKILLLNERDAALF